MQFTMNEAEARKVKLWKAVHYIRREHVVAWWRRLWYWARRRPVPLAVYEHVFVDTGIGTKVIVRCECGASLDATDYDRW